MEKPAAALAAAPPTGHMWLLSPCNEAYCKCQTLDFEDLMQNKYVKYLNF